MRTLEKKMDLSRFRKPDAKEEEELDIDEEDSLSDGGIETKRRKLKTDQEAD